MKAFEVKIQKDRSIPGQCHFTWPEWWDEKVVNIVAMEGAGKDVELAIVTCSDEAAAEIKARKDKRVTWPTDATLDKHGREWRPQITSIRDEVKVNEVLDKIVRNETLSATDFAVIDADDPSPGRTKSAQFSIKHIKGE